ncbi:MAG TPA: hypothetical protein VFN21_13940 [Acidimicrobiales bacterium]|nr:hypothetical protein [Acidimicrobiales bacterium]
MAAEPGTQGSWPDQAADLIVSTVGTVRDKTVGPAMTAARGVVYGFFALLVGLCALVLATIFIIRIITVYTGKVWIPQIGLGVIFGIVALVLWGKARRVPHR